MRNDKQTDNHAAARFDTTISAVVIERLHIKDKDVIDEARRWVHGARGPAVDDPDVLAGADLGAYVTEAMRMGAHALSVTGQAHEARAIERLLKEVGEKTAHSTTSAAEATQRTVREASEAVAKAATEAKTALTEADARSRKEFTTAVTAASQTMNTELRRIFAGESPELLERLRPILAKFATDLDTQVRTSTTELMAKAVKQFDPADPASPMAKHTAELTARQQELTQHLDAQHTELTTKLTEMSTALQVQQATTQVAKVTPIKGDKYEHQMHTLLRELAVGLGDDYAETGTTTGSVPRSKRGDGVLTVHGGVARVVLEMTDSQRQNWTGYLDDAERNRDASASLGVVRTVDQNAGHAIRVLGGQRVVLAFDPDHDDIGLLRTVVQLLRATAITTAGRRGVHHVATAEEKIAEALTHLTKIDSIKKTSATIQKSATKIDSECVGLDSAIQRLLDEALAALASASTITDDHSETSGAA